MGSSLADIFRGFLISTLGLNPDSLLSNADLEQLYYTQNPVLTKNNVLPRDLIGNRPTPVDYGKGLFFAEDDGTLWYSDLVDWIQLTNPLSWASGTQLAYSPINTISPVVNSNVAADVDPALVITIPASNVPVKIKGRILGQQATGASAAVGSFDTLVVALTDVANNVLDFDVSPAVQVTLASKTWYHTFKVETVLPAPFAGGTYKLRTYLLNALPTGWSASLLATGPTWPKAWLEAVAE